MSRSRGGSLAACPFACQRRESSDSTPKRSESCCCAAATALFRLQQKHAGVAVSMTCLASACVVSGVLGGRSAPLESAAAKVCREAHARVSANVFVRDLDLQNKKGSGGAHVEKGWVGGSTSRGASAEGGWVGREEGV